MYSFEYDPLDRLADSRHYLNASPSNSFEEKNISYDLNGNILTMTRVGESGDENEVTYSYSGNQLTSSIYDLNGNITYDVTSGLTMEWNHLDLIKKVSNNSGVLINYTYLSDGTVDASGEGLEYRGSLTFRRSSDGTLTPESIAFSGGRIVAVTSSGGAVSFVVNHYVTDNLGSVRAVVSGSPGQVAETNDYYAFGGRWDSSGSLVDQSNRYRYNGKEEQATFGTPYSDYGARQYSSTSGRWIAVDPLAEKYYDISPYAFCNNNPVNFVDPDGMREWPVNPQYNGFIRRHENNYKNPRPKHNGVDINIGAGNNDLGAPVYATHDGVVTRYVTINDDSNAGGNRIQITSENGEVASYYMHLNSMSSFKVGDYITEGTIIGTIGGSGKGIENAYAPHLHYELKIDGEYVNPAIDSQKLIDPQTIITPVDMGMLSPAIVEGQGKPMTISLPIVQILLDQEQKLNYEIR